MEKLIELMKQQVYLGSESGSLFVVNQIKLLLDVVKDSNTFDDSILVFSILEDIQFMLAKAAYADEILFDDFIMMFIRDFDRVDDYQTKYNLFCKFNPNQQ